MGCVCYVCRGEGVEPVETEVVDEAGVTRLRTVMRRCGGCNGSGGFDEFADVEEARRAAEAGRRRAARSETRRDGDQCADD